ncbi:MAG: putative metal-binding motif-containing protein [Candidatus Jorgensenbacteria bacterium]|nr:putative metal-binding motif-containing protein [Candidatus Jorgensenbacteria bacterium]
MLEFIKKYRLIFALVILFLPLALYGINTLSEGYQSTPSSNITINAASRSDACRKINNTSGDTYFVPTNTAGEWSTFLSNLPPSTTSAQCCAVGECWNGSSCVTADTDSDGAATTACLSTNNGGSDCNDGIASINPGATGSCNSNWDDNCDSDVDVNMSLGTNHTPESWDGAYKATYTETQWYSEADCGGSIVAKNTRFDPWDMDCSTASLNPGGGGGGGGEWLPVKPDYFGIVGNCYNQWAVDFGNAPTTGSVAYNSRWRSDTGCVNESSSVPTYRPATGFDGTSNPPGYSCNCASGDGSQLTNWTCY